VKSHEMTRKLNRVAEDLKDIPIKDTTRIDWYCLTERERVLNHYKTVHAGP
jgi:hypothetical protein